MGKVKHKKCRKEGKAKAKAKRGKTFMIGRPTGKPTGKELPKGVPRAKAKMAMAMAKERSQDPLATDSTVEK